MFKHKECHYLICKRIPNMSSLKCRARGVCQAFQYHSQITDRHALNWSCRACVLKVLSAPRLQIPETSHQVDFSILGHRTDLGTPTRFSAADWYATGYARKRWSTPSWPNKAKLAGHQISKTCLKIKNQRTPCSTFVSFSLPYIQIYAPFLVNPIWWWFSL